MGTLMAIERVARHLIRVIASGTQEFACHVHAGSLKILIRHERLIAARHAIKGRPLLERERVNRHMMRSCRQNAIECALPTRCGLPGKSAHKVARHVKPSVLDRRDSSERPIGIVNTTDGGKFGVIERLHAQRDACDTNLGKRSGKLGGQRLGIGLAGKLNGGAPRTNTPRQLHQTLPRQRRRATANIDGANLIEGPGLAKSIEARVQLLKIGIERSTKLARSETARIKVAVAALLGTERHVRIQRGNGHP